ncbi:Biopolymer transport protein ExbD/TolR [compost metagenome]
MERVQASLARLLTEQPDASLVIQADERVPHGRVVRVMDEAKAAGIANIAVAVAPK